MELHAAPSHVLTLQNASALEIVSVTTEGKTVHEEAARLFWECIRSTYLLVVQERDKARGDADYQRSLVRDVIKTTDAKSARIAALEAELAEARALEKEPHRQARRLADALRDVAMDTGSGVRCWCLEGRDPDPETDVNGHADYCVEARGAIASLET